MMVERMNAARSQEYHDEYRALWERNPKEPNAVALQV
jgi:hypothetical protein